jgi:hypothetical protein
MLRPGKHSHPDRTVINVAVLLFVRLKARRVGEYEELRQYVKKAVSGGDVLFLPALNFLFLLGLIRYLRKTDSIEYLEPNEII